MVADKRYEGYEVCLQFPDKWLIGWGVDVVGIAKYGSIDRLIHVSNVNETLLGRD